MLSLARLITSSEFLLNLKVIDIADRNTMRRFLLFLLEHVQLEVGSARNGIEKTKFLSIYFVFAAGRSGNKSDQRAVVASEDR